MRSTDGSGHTALHWAAFWGRTEACVALLEELGADADARSADASTALHLAAAAGHVATAAALLAQGARVDAKDDDGRTPLVRAAMLGAAQQEEAGGHAAVVALLLEHGSTLPKPVLVAERVLHWLARQGEGAALRAVVGACATEDAVYVLEACDRAGRTPLAVAAKEGQADCAAALLAAGAALESRDRSGATPFLLSCFGGDSSCEAALRKAGADTAASDKFGNDCAAYRAKTLRREAPEPKLAEAEEESAEPAGRARCSCWQRVLCCFRWNRVHADSGEPLAPH